MTISDALAATALEKSFVSYLEENGAKTIAELYEAFKKHFTDYGNCFDFARSLQAKGHVLFSKISVESVADTEVGLPR